MRESFLGHQVDRLKTKNQRQSQRRHHDEDIMEATKGRLAHNICYHRMADRMAFHTSLELCVASWNLYCAAFDLSCSLVGTIRTTSVDHHLICRVVRYLGDTLSTDTLVVACFPPSFSRLVTVSLEHFAP